MWKLLLIGSLGGGGAIARYLVSTACVRWFGEGFPVGTLIVNVVGCFLLGALYQLSALGGIPNEWRQPLGIGFLGGLTTFSTFGYETFDALEKGKWHIAGGNVASHLLLGLAAVWLGIMLVKMLALQT
ncbi:MAG: fluoride efflux transporter CrcB [Planctomycetaceae bacterium]|nr:fluoride efflux transporter CrcB [Planctomycetaceae bacterium]